MSGLKHLFAAGALVLSTLGPATAGGLVGDVWSVCGWDGLLTWHDTRLVFTSQSEAEGGAVIVQGYFDWRSSRGHTGREQFVGQLGADGSLALQGLDIDADSGLVTSRYEARLSESGASIIDGVWLDGAPGIWAAQRDGGQGTAVALCETEAQLS